MSFEEHLNSLLEYSNNIASIKFRNGTSNVSQDLFSPQKKLIRDAEPHEVKLAAFCAGDPNATTRLMQDRTSVNGVVGTKREDVERILRAANTLNQMCNIPGMKEKIEELAHVHEDRQTNLDYLYEAYRKNDAEMEQLTNIEPMYMDLDETDVEKKIRQEEAAIQRYERELHQRKSQSKAIQNRKLEHNKINDELIKLQQKTQATMIKTAGDAELDALEKEILSLKQSIIEQDTNMELIQVEIESKTSLLSSNSTTVNTSIKELNTGLKARIDKLLNSNDQSTKPTMDELNALVKSFQATEKGLQSFLACLQKIHTKERQEGTTRTIYVQLLDFILHQKENASPTSLDELFPDNSDIPKDTSFFKPSDEIKICATILMKLYDQNDQEMTLENLTQFVQAYATEIGFSEKEAVKSIYKLVGQDLVVIDRSRNDYSTVKLKL